MKLFTRRLYIVLSICCPSLMVSSDTLSSALVRREGRFILEDNLSNDLEKESKFAQMCHERTLNETKSWADLAKEKRVQLDIKKFEERESEAEQRIILEAINKENADEEKKLQQGKQRVPASLSSIVDDTMKEEARAIEAKFERDFKQQYQQLQKAPQHTHNYHKNILLYRNHKTDAHTKLGYSLSLFYRQRRSPRGTGVYR